MQTTISAEMLSLMVDGHVACQSPHYNCECTVEVVALSIGCTDTRMVCGGAVAANRAAMLRPGAICFDCLNLAADCWQIRPI